MGSPSSFAGTFKFEINDEPRDGDVPSLADFPFGTTTVFIVFEPRQASIKKSFGILPKSLTDSGRRGAIKCSRHITINMQSNTLRFVKS